METTTAINYCSTSHNFISDLREELQIVDTGVDALVGPKFTGSEFDTTAGIGLAEPLRVIMVVTVGSLFCVLSLGSNSLGKNLTSDTLSELKLNTEGSLGLELLIGYHVWPPSMSIILSPSKVQLVDLPITTVSTGDPMTGLLEFLGSLLQMTTESTSTEACIPKGCNLMERNRVSTCLVGKEKLIPQQPTLDAMTDHLGFLPSIQTGKIRENPNFLGSLHNLGGIGCPTVENLYQLSGIEQRDIISHGLEG
jgi:hypothetical protein